MLVAILIDRRSHAVRFCSVGQSKVGSRDQSAARCALKISYRIHNDKSCRNPSSLIRYFRGSEVTTGDDRCRRRPFQKTRERRVHWENTPLSSAGIDATKSREKSVFKKTENGDTPKNGNGQKIRKRTPPLQTKRASIIAQHTRTTTTTNQMIYDSE